MPPRSSAGAGRTASRVDRLVRRAVDAIQADELEAGLRCAEEAVRAAPRSGLAWQALALARERSGDLAKALEAYGSALEILPDHSEITNDLGRLASRMGMKTVAEQLFRRYVANHPDALGALVNLASVVMDQGRHAEAIDLLKAAIKARPEEPSLWNALGLVLCEQGELDTALVFLDEALRLSPHFFEARYNRGNARLEVGLTEAALDDCEQALRAAGTRDERLTARFARATIRLACGKIGDGWDDYEARLTRPRAPTFLVDSPRWTPETPLAGKGLLLVGEQGLGDEILFANVLPDVIEALGSDGKLALAVEPRLARLFSRSFPGVEVVPHATRREGGRDFRSVPALGEPGRFALWAPLGSLPRRFRRRIEDFPARAGFLAPDPERVRRWRDELERAPPGRKVGLLWKSMKRDSDRARYYAPFQAWAPILTTPGVAFVNLQYGDCADELAWAAQALGVEIWTPPGVDLTNDLDEVAALACALDLTLGFANATFNIVAACGAPAWIISVPGAWTRLGEARRLPWYPQTRVFLPAGFNRWDEVIASVAGELAELGGRTS